MKLRPVISNSHPGRAPIAMLYPKTPYRLVIILVAERHTAYGNTSQGVQNISNLDIRSNPTHVDDGIEGQRVAVMVDAVDRVSTYGRVIVLPDTEAVIDEAVVHIEERITGASRDIGHDATDTVVSISVGSRPIGRQLVHQLLFLPLFSSGETLTRLRCSSPYRRTRIGSCKC
jgi:hypothetical protein